MATTDEMTASFTTLQSRAASLARLTDAARKLAPPSGSGTDNSGLIAVRVGQDGIPKSVRIDRRWQRRIAPEKFGAAVVAASQAAVANRLSRWARALRESGWISEFDDLDRATPVPPAALSAMPAPPRARLRPIEVIAEELITTLDSIADLSTDPGTSAATGTGTDRAGKLTITVSSIGLVSCRVDARLVARHSVATLMTAVAEALTAATTELANAPKRAIAMPALTALLDEALALLQSPGPTGS
jgi:hypothetical protein